MLCVPTLTSPSLHRKQSGAKQQSALGCGGEERGLKKEKNCVEIYVKCENVKRNRGRVF